MRMVVTLVALAVGLAGCSGGSPKADADAVVDSTVDDDSNSTPPAPIPTVPLTATLGASALNGSLPLPVTFEFGAAGITDPIWALDFADGSPPINGSVIPSTANHTFTTSGHFSVVLTVTDGDAVAYASLNITVVDGLPLTIQALDFSYEGTSASCADPSDAMVFGTPANGVLWAEWTIDPNTVGQTYVASYSGPNTVFRIGFMAFYGADDHLVAFEFKDGGDITGTVPVGAIHGVFSDCLIGPVSGHYTTTGTLPLV